MNPEDRAWESFWVTVMWVGIFLSILGSGLWVSAGWAAMCTGIIALWTNRIIMFKQKQKKEQGGDKPGAGDNGQEE